METYTKIKNLIFHQNFNKYIIFLIIHKKKLMIKNKKNFHYNNE